jgi:hypothetical protein
MKETEKTEGKTDSCVTCRRYFSCRNYLIQSRRRQEDGDELLGGKDIKGDRGKK